MTVDEASFETHDTPGFHRQSSPGYLLNKLKTKVLTHNGDLLQTPSTLNHINYKLCAQLHQFNFQDFQATTQEGDRHRCVS